jgi:oligoribonuclease (3'-5' exoribonuclease)
VKLLWLDLESSGLDPTHDRILEIAVRVARLEQPFDVRQSFSWVIPCSRETRAHLADDWVEKTHTASGLWEACHRAHATASDPAWAHDRALMVVDAALEKAVAVDADDTWHRAARNGTATCEHCKEPLTPEMTLPAWRCAKAAKANKTTIAGSSAHFDLGFVRAHLPRTAALLAHRVYDTSAIALFCQSLGMPPVEVPEAERTHRADADIDRSIAHAKACAMWLRGQGFYDRQHWSAEDDGTRPSDGWPL